TFAGAGQISFSNGTSTSVSGTIVNDSNVLLNSTGSFTDLSLNGNVTLTGSGTLTLQNADRVLGSGPLINQITIQGETSNSGSLGASQIAIVNNGLIDANVSGLVLNVDPLGNANGNGGLVNNNLMRASNGGILLLNGLANGGNLF